MSISLVIKWPSRGHEVIPVCSTGVMMKGWRPLAIKLGLKLIPEFYSAFWIEQGELDQLLGELATFRAELVRLGAGYEQSIESVDRLTDAFQRLKQAEGWDASIG